MADILHAFWRAATSPAAPWAARWSIVAVLAVAAAVLALLAFG